MLDGPTLNPVITDERCCVHLEMMKLHDVKHWNHNFDKFGELCLFKSTAGYKHFYADRYVFHRRRMDGH